MSNEESSFANGAWGAFFGAITGCGLGLGVFLYSTTAPLFFTGDIILLGATLCSLIGLLLGLLLGVGFVDWLKENWWGFWL